jgi:hypothetical protein
VVRRVPVVIIDPAAANLWPDTAWTARDWEAPTADRLPELRAALIDHLGKWTVREEVAGQLARGKGTLRPAGTPEQGAALILSEEQQRLREAELYYVNADMIETVRDAAAAMPVEWALTRQDLPSEQGFVLYGAPVHEYVSRDFLRRRELVKLVGASWGPTSMAHPELGGTWITFWSATDHHAIETLYRQEAETTGRGEGYRTMLAERDALTRSLKSKTPGARERIRAAIATLNSRIDQVHPAVVDPRAYAHAIRAELTWDNETILTWGPDSATQGLRTIGRKGTGPPPAFGHPDAGTIDFSRLVLCTWLLIHQANVVTVSDQPAPRRAARKLAQAGHPAGGVRVVALQPRLRYAPPEPAAEPGETSAETRRRLVKRSRVRTHWRDQAVGPGWSQHRRILIHKHERGPEGNGYYDTTTVKVLKS